MRLRSGCLVAVLVAYVLESYGVRGCVPVQLRAVTGSARTHWRALLMRFGCKPIVSSNLTSSAGQSASAENDHSRRRRFLALLCPCCVQNGGAAASTGRPARPAVQGPPPQRATATARPPDPSATQLLAVRLSDPIPDRHGAGEAVGFVDLVVLDPGADAGVADSDGVAGVRN